MTHILRVKKRRHAVSFAQDDMFWVWERMLGGGLFVLVMVT